MDREQARAYAKTCLASYLEQRGLPLNKPFRCLDPAHTDSNPSMSFDKANNRVVCFSCGARFDIFDLVGIDYNLSDRGEIFRRTYELLNISVDSGKPLEWNATIGGRHTEQQKQAGSQTAAQNTEPAPAPAPHQPEQPKEYPVITDYLNRCAARAAETDYFSRRGLSAALVQRFGLGYDPAFDPSGGKAPSCTRWKAVIIPNGERFCIVRNTNPAADSKDRYRKIGNNKLWNVEALYSAGRKPVFVVEGEFDALSIIEAGGEALALGSSTNYSQLLAIIDGRKEPLPKPLVIALDNDEAGVKAAEALVEGLTKRKASFYRGSDIYGEHKDANAALLADREKFTAAIAYINDTERREYAKNSAAGHIAEFVNGIAESVNTPHVSTGFERLDAALDGGLYEGLYTLGAISSLGKTTFLLQMIDQIAQSGTDCLIFSLEMARSQLMARSISRLTLLQVLENGGDVRNAKSERGITAGERYENYSPAEMDLIRSSIQRYSEYAAHIYIHEGVGDIGIEQVKQTVTKHIQITGRAPVVLIDYLQILAPYDPRMTDKQNTDKAVIELKRLSRDYKLPIICISSFNRDNYRAEVSETSFKESGAIEYSSDVLLGLQLKGAGALEREDIDAALRADPREIELKIIKNRSGQRNIKVGFEYHPVFNYYRETEAVEQEADERPAAAITVRRGRGRKKRAELKPSENGLVYSAPVPEPEANNEE